MEGLLKVINKQAFSFQMSLKCKIYKPEEIAKQLSRI